MVSGIGAEPVSVILQRAASQLGTPYRSGGMAPGGFDCSGFISYLYRPTLPGLPRLSRDMARSGNPVNGGSWLPGDLLFYATGSDPNRINHVAIWYGDGHIIHSISDGPETGVVITPADARYWNRRYVSSRRVLPDNAAPLPDNPLLQENPSDTALPRPSSSEAEKSPWNDFEGYLRGDFEAWKSADEEAFEAYKRENG